MKAKEYYEKYGDKIYEEWAAGNESPAVNELFREMFHEIYYTLKKRHAKTNTAVMAVIDEQNQKWNAIIRLYEKDGKWSPLIPDGFKKGAILLINEV